MFIRVIIEENPKNPQEDIENEAKELIEVKRAIERLNGKDVTAVILKRDETNQMTIGGGENKKYVVIAKLNGKNYIMSNKFDVQKDPLEIIVGGKTRVYPSRKCMNLEMVLEGAKHFADRGALAQTFNWETQ